MLGSSRSTTTQQLPQGGSVSTVSTQKTLPGQGKTPIIAAPGAPAPPAAGQKPTVMKNVRPYDPTNRVDRIAVETANDANNLHQATNAADKYQITERMAELGLEPNNITGSVRERAKNARLILDHLDDVDRLIDGADKAGELGVVATRWNDFLSGKLGDDPTKDQVFSKLSSNLRFLSTAVSMAHGGLRGGGSPQMVEHWEKALFATTPYTLKAKLAQARKWMEGYAKMDKASGVNLNMPGAAQAGGKEDLRKKYNY
jgi:hypothetical protein